MENVTNGVTCGRNALTKDILKTIFHSVNDAILIHDLNGKVMAVNQRMCDIYEVAEGEVVGKTIHETFSYDENAKAQLTKIWEKVLDGQCQLFEWQARRPKSDTGFFVEVFLRRISMKGKDVILATVRDLDQKRQLAAQISESEERYRSLFENFRDGIYRSTVDGKFLSVNTALVEILGYDSKEELLSIDIAKDLYVSSKDRPSAQDRDGIHVHRLKKKDGSQIWAESNSWVMYDENHQVSYYEGIVRDITERKRVEDTLDAERKRLAITLKSIGDAVISTDDKGGVIMMNKVAEELTGWRNGDALGKPLEEVFYIINEYTRKRCENPVEKVLRTGNIVGLANHTSLISKDGTEYCIDDSAAPICDKEGNIIGVILVFRDVSIERKRHRKIEYLSFHDKLTGLYNRVYLEEELKRLDTERQLPISMIMGDVNGLKLVNDAFGHDLGDILLSKVAQILKSVCRSEDIIARWGGDEFVILLPKADSEVAADICKRITAVCRRHNKDPVKPNISLGYAVKDESSQDIFNVLKEAEDWMYRKKLMDSRSARSSIIASLENSLYERSHETTEHALRIGKLASQLGKAIGISESDMDDLALLAKLHDIGKISVPDEVLLKDGPLSSREWKTMKRHPESGYRIAVASDGLAHIADAILAHHEWWDGSGYPNGLKGEQIPIIARILAIADAYDVMTNGRPYKKAISNDQALKKIGECAGTQFDPGLVEMLLKLKSK